MTYFINIDVGGMTQQQLADLLHTIAKCVEKDPRRTVLPIDDGQGTYIGHHGYLGSDFEDDIPPFSQAQAVTAG